MFNFNHLYYFYLTAKYGSVTQAARYLRISQPSLSMQLKTFERSVGKSLFVKAGRSLELTADGLACFGICRRIFGLAEELWDEVTGEKDARASRIKIGITSDIERPFIAEMLGGIIKNKKRNALPSLALETIPQKEASHAMVSRQIDALVSSAPIQSEAFTMLNSVQLPVNLVISRRLMAQPIRGKISAKRLLRELPGGLVLPSLSLPFRFEIDSFLLRQGVSRSVVLESDMMVIVGKAILDGIGFGFFPTAYLRREIRNRRIDAFGPKAGFWQHRIFLYVTPQLSADPVIQSLKQALNHLASGTGK